VGVAIVDAVRPWLLGIPLGLHWPNDVYADGKKLAGILIDVLPDGRNIVGIGVNANNTLEGAPDEVRQRATTLRDLTGALLDRTELLLSVLANLKSCVQSAAADPPAFGARFQDLCLQVGRELTVRVGQQHATGRCAGIAPDGALLLETADGWQRFYSGTLH
jgi:BirA family biotin operon repressor/biotin-[acetyl-CoA-carboxylase] ligase